MAEEKIVQAKKVFQTLCEALDRREWKYDKDEEKLIVDISVSGDDIPMRLLFIIDADRQLVRILSPLPFKMSEAKRMDGAIAACVASYGMADGSFDYDISDGTIYYRMTASFMGSVIGEGLLQYLISCSCAMVDLYNDKFLALDKGMMDIAEFIKDR